MSFAVTKWLAVGSVIVVACGSGGRDRLAGTGDAGAAGAPSATAGDASPVPVLGQPPSPGDDGACAKIDLVFVVDDSQSMVEEQQNLAQNFGLVTSKLDAFVTKSGAKLDYR